MFKNTVRLFSSLTKTLQTQLRPLMRSRNPSRSLAFQPFSLFCQPYSKKEQTDSKIISSIVKTKPTKIISSIVPQELRNDDDDDDEKQSETSWRTMKYTFLAFGFSVTGLGTLLLYEFGKTPTDLEGNEITDEFSTLPKLQQYFSRTMRELEYYKRLIKEPSREKLLPDPVQPPYYQPPYTLVLEMTDVLVHPDYTYQTGWRFKKRPGIDHFLESLNGVFEIVIFTAEQGMTVFPIIEALDPNNLISYKLVRDATHYVSGHHVKDLSKLNRDLKKVIAIDWNSESVKFQPDNLFHLKRWPGNDEDSTLIDLAAFLRTIAQSEIEDVREVLKYYSQFEDPLSTFREKQRQLMEREEADRQKEAAKTVPVVKRWAPGLLS